MRSNKHILIVGAGLAGLVIARSVSETFGWRVHIIDEREHIGGNCYTSRDRESGVMEHVYGPHIFNTNHEDVIRFVSRFGEWRNFSNRVKAVNSRGVFSMPINLHTINQLFGKTLSPQEAQAFIAQIAVKFSHKPRNFEEQALSLLGEEIYRTFFYGYTKKQWGCEPSELPADILKRLPIRFNYNDAFYSTKYQLMPVDGYTAVMDRMMDSSLITCNLGTSFSREMAAEYDHCFYSGALDRYFNYSHGRLGYRTVFFDRVISEGDFQGNAVINYTDFEAPYTRVHEHKHFTPWEAISRTLVLKERSKETGENDVPFYPKRLHSDMERYAIYERLADAEFRTTFVGRLGTYRYLDMDQVIGESLDLVRLLDAQLASVPRFSPVRGKL